jgi:hypothetical protein
VNFSATDATAAGRMCPIDYVYPPSEFDHGPEMEAEVLYVVGGLYGNLEALSAVERLAAAERTPATIVFNGDFHWFDAEPAWFAAVDAAVARHSALRGNVETEIARPDDVGAGCGCAYPPDVDDGVVLRSNDILGQLRSAMPSGVRDRLTRLPMHLVASVGDLRIGVVHGDAASLAGWRFAVDALDSLSQRPWLDDIRRRSKIDVFASTHTCLAALRDFELRSGRLTVINNGAAGMPNFTASTFGLISRIATVRSPHRTLYGLTRNGVHIDAIALHYDQQAFVERFLGRWPERSPAYTSYFGRITRGPDHPMARALAGS